MALKQYRTTDLLQLGEKIQPVSADVCNVQSELPVQSLNVAAEAPACAPTHAANDQSAYALRPFWQEMLRELLEQKKYTCSQIAYRSGLPKTTVHKLVRGVSQSLSYRNFCKLLRLYCAVCYDAAGKKREYL